MTKYPIMGSGQGHDLLFKFWDPHSFRTDEVSYALLGAKPSVWNSLTYNCRSAELLSTFRSNLTRRMAITNGTCVSFCNQLKAHFGLLSVCPWDNRSKCHMDEKRIQCWSNA